MWGSQRLEAIESSSIAPTRRQQAEAASASEVLRRFLEFGQTAAGIIIGLRDLVEKKERLRFQAE